MISYFVTERKWPFNEKIKALFKWTTIHFMLDTPSGTYPLLKNKLCNQNHIYEPPPKPQNPNSLSLPHPRVLIFYDCTSSTFFPNELIWIPPPKFCYSCIVHCTLSHFMQDLTIIRWFVCGMYVFVEKVYWKKKKNFDRGKILRNVSEAFKGFKVIAWREKKSYLPQPSFNKKCHVRQLWGSFL